MLISSGNR